MRTAERLRYLVLAVQREGNRQRSADLRPLGITPAQSEALRILGDHAPMTLSDVGRMLVCESGTNPSRIIDRLVDAGARRSGCEPRRSSADDVDPDGGWPRGRAVGVRDRAADVRGIGGRPRGHRHRWSWSRGGCPCGPTLALAPRHRRAVARGQAGGFGSERPGRGGFVGFGRQRGCWGSALHLHSIERRLLKRRRQHWRRDDGDRRIMDQASSATEV